MHCNDVRYTSAIKDLVSFDARFAANIPKDAGKICAGHLVLIPKPQNNVGLRFLG
jgi:hypothetical protein